MDPHGTLWTLMFVVKIHVCMYIFRPTFSSSSKRSKPSKRVKLDDSDAKQEAEVNEVKDAVELKMEQDDLPAPRKPSGQCPNVHPHRLSIILIISGDYARNGGHYWHVCLHMFRGPEHALCGDGDTMQS